MTRICVLGLGEAGAAIAADLAAIGVEVKGYDPGEVGTPAGVSRRDDPAGAVVDADIVLSLTASADASGALAQVLNAIPRHAIYADVSASSAGLKRRLARMAEDAGVKFVDVALMSPVPGSGLRTPALVSGPVASDFVAAMLPLGMRLDVVGDEAGQAATRKLLRSIVMKGLAAVIIESLQAAQAAGLADETWENLVAQLASIDEALVRRLVTGTGLHAARRLEEMKATIELLTDLGVEPIMSDATAMRLQLVRDEPARLPDIPE